MPIYDMIVIGGGPAGYTAALYAARAGLSVLVLERMSIGGQMALTDVIDNYPGFAEGVDGITLGMQMQAGAERFGAKTEYAEVTAASLAEAPKRIETTNGRYFAHTVVIATGAEPRRLGLVGEESLLGSGVHYCAHCDGRFYKGKDVLVVGGGNSAASDALYLSRLARQVTVIHRRDTLRATRVYHAPLMRAENVRFLWNSTVEELLQDGRFCGVRVRDLKTDALREIPADGLFVSIGREPSTSLFSGEIMLDSTGYIMADETTKTNLAGVYAVGDVRTKMLRQVVTAVGDGAVAAHFAEEYLAECGITTQN